MANPSPGTPEWVELHNSADQAFDLAGWKIDDQKDGAPFIIPEGNMISAGESKRISLPTAMLNNDGDTVRIIAPDGKEIMSAAFTTAEREVPLCIQPQGVARCSDATPTSTITNTPSAPRQIVANVGQGSISIAPAEKPLDEQTLIQKDGQIQPYQLTEIGSRYTGIMRTPEPTTMALTKPMQAGAITIPNTQSSSQSHAYDPILALLFGIVAACATFLFYASQQKQPASTAASQEDQES